MRRSLILALLGLFGFGGALSAQLTRPLAEDEMDAFKWRSVGPTNMMGRVTDVEGIPGPSKTFYVAAAAGGVWKTTNNGATFKLVWNGPRVASMGDIGIAPSDTNQVWVGTGEEDSRNSISPGGGIFESTDGGETWEFKGLKETQVIARIVVHPTDPDIVYVAALGHIWDSNPERGLYRTTDGGETWDLVKFVSDKAGFVDVLLDPRDPDVVWAASWERQRGPYFLQSGGPGSALWRSTDGGDTWTEVKGNGFPTAMKGRIGLAVSLSDPDIMYAMVEAEKEEDGSGGSGLYRSEDGGLTWEKRNDENTRPFYYSQVRVDPQDPDRIYFSSTPVRYSDDGGKTWGTTTNGIHVDQHAMWIDPTDGDRMVVGNDGGVAITYDRGGNWSYLNNIALGQFYDVSYNMDVPYRVCGGLQDNGTWCGPSRLAEGRINKYHWATISGGDGFVSAQDPADPNLVWSESQGGNVGRSRLDTGERKSLRKPDWEDVWTPKQDTIVMLLEEGVPESDARIQRLREEATRDSANAVMRYNWNTPFLQSAHHREWFYMAGNRVLKSESWGDSLRIISPDLSYADPEKIEVSTKTTGGITPDVTGAETFATIVALEESPLEEGWLYAGTDDGRVWMTRDDGEHWTELTDRFSGVPEGTYVSRIEASNHDAGRFYVTFDNHRRNDFTPYLFVTDDGGKSFRSIAAGLPTGSVDFLHVVKEDPHNPDLLFVGSDVGAYVSTDRGRSWQPFMNGLPVVPVHDLEIHPRDRELIAATHGRSIWIVDIAPLEQLSDDLVAQEAALFAPKPAFQFGMEPRGGESYGQQWFSRPTPGSVAEISYYLSADAAKAIAEARKAEEAKRKEAAGDTAQAGGARGAGAAARKAAADTAQAGAGGQTPGGRRAGAARSRRGGPQVEITITAPDGTVFRKLQGPATEGLHTIRWNFRGEQPDAPELSPYERKERERIAARARVVADSLKEAGWSAMFLDRMVGVLTGQVSRRQMFQMFGGGGGGGARDPEAFQERPGERRGGTGFDFGRMRTLADLVMPGAGLGTLFRRLGRGGGEAPLAEPQAYTVTLKVGEKTFTQPLIVERVGELTGENAPFEEVWERFLERLDEGR
ncbi:MAG: WD40/YVTN/BNR-like repeat-containing protein [Gemmatimonadota bacterium]